MKETEDVLRKQLIAAMEDGQYKILLHRTYTEGLGLNEEGTTRDICRQGLKIFGGRNIGFSTSNYQNDIEQIINQIKNAHTYKASDKVFILRIPTNALEYTPGNTRPILYNANEISQYGEECFCVSPEYVLGYVETSPEGISDLHPNTLEWKKIREEDLAYTSSVTGQYRDKMQDALKNIKTDRYYTGADKRQILQILYAKSKKNDQISRRLQRYIKNLMPEENFAKWGVATPYNLEYHNIVEMFCQRQNGKKITVKMVEEEFSKPRRLMVKEIVRTIPFLIGRENETGRTLSQEEIIQIVAETNGFDKDRMVIANQPERSIIEEMKLKIKALFAPKQKLLEAQNTKIGNGREEFLKGINFDTGKIENPNRENIQEEQKEKEEQGEGRE